MACRLTANDGGTIADSKLAKGGGIDEPNLAGSKYIGTHRTGQGRKRCLPKMILSPSMPMKSVMLSTPNCEVPRPGESGRIASSEHQLIGTRTSREAVISIAADMKVSPGSASEGI